MTVLEAIHRRRSIRNYQDRQIPEEALRQILKAGPAPPTPAAGSGRSSAGCAAGRWPGAWGAGTWPGLTGAAWPEALSPGSSPAPSTTPPSATAFTARLRCA